MMMTKEEIDISKQIALLLEHGRDPDGNLYRLSDVAKVTGIRYQTLSNLMKKPSSNPRLETLRSLCRLYGISLDYFSCETEEACMSFLKGHIASSSAKIREINDQTSQLSGKGQRNVIAIMEWMLRATKG